jgi:tryptophan synthase alpha chain
VAPTLRAPLILFTYYNPILRRGAEKFIAEISAAGGGGLLIPDIPLEETGEARALCAKHGLELVLLATPTTSTARMEKIAAATNGFVYLVSVTGVTGVQDKMEARVQDLVRSRPAALRGGRLRVTRGAGAGPQVQKLKSVTSKPVAVGFGISKPEQAALVASWGADGIIVGSALVRALGTAATPGAEC